MTTAASSSAASFQIANLTINPYEPLVNHPVVISVGVANSGNIQGSYSLSFKINDTVAETQKLVLSANETQLITFNVTETSAGIYNVTVGDLSGTLQCLT